MFAPTAVLRALAAPKAHAFGVELHPVTLAHLAALEAHGCRLLGGGPVSMRDYVVAFHVLTEPAREAHAGAERPLSANINDGAFAEPLNKLSNGPSKEVRRECEAIAAHLRAAFAAHLPTKGKRISTMKHLGLVPEMAEFLMSEYKMTYETALFDTPIARAHILLAAASLRNGAEFDGPTYIHQDILAARAAAKAAQAAQAAEAAEAAPGNVG
jgi:hypothetical protein